MKIQQKVFGFKESTLEKIINALQDFEATKKIEFEETDRDFNNIDQSEIELGSDVYKFEKRVGTETSFCIRFFKGDNSIYTVSP